MDETKLPKAIQSELLKLREDVKYLREKLKTFEGEPSNIYSYDHVNKYYIPDENIVEFLINNDEISIRIIDNKIHINAYHGALRIQPYSTNVINIWSERY